MGSDYPRCHRCWQRCTVSPGAVPLDDFSLNLCHLEHAEYLQLRTTADLVMNLRAYHLP